MSTGMYVKRRNGSANFYARILVPSDLLQLVGRSEVWTSLKTPDEKEARRRSAPVFAKHLTEFDRLRRSRAPTEGDLQQAAYEHFTAELETDRAGRATAPKRAAHDADKVRIAEEIRGGVEAHLGHVADLAISDPTRHAVIATKTRELRRKVIVTHLREGETTYVEWAADHFIASQALDIAKGSPAYVELCQRLQRAELEALKKADEFDQGIFDGTITDPVVRAPSASQKAPAAKPGETISELFETFYRERKGAVTADTWDQNRMAIDLFADYLGRSAHKTAITRKAVSAWKHQLMLWPRQAANTKAFEGLGFKDTIARNVTIGKQPISDKTINRYLSGIAPFCEWLLVNEHIDADAMRGMYLVLDKSVSKIRPYTEAQLGTIFSSPIFVGCQSDSKEHLTGDHVIRDWRYWLPILALFTGARLGELCQLATADVRMIEGTWVIHVTTEGEGEKKVKTAGSRRVIPLHPKLIEQGFLLFHGHCVSAKQARLFPTMIRDQRGHFGEASRFFGRYFARVGVKVDSTVNFHSFRHGIADAFRRAGYRDEEFAPLLGHTKASTTGRYGILREGEIKTLTKMIGALQFPTVFSADKKKYI